MTKRFTSAMSALMVFVEKGSADDRICNESFRIVRDDLGIKDELVLLAARFQYPLSPGCDREKQLAALQTCGYSLNDAKRIITLMETQRGLDGDRDKQVLADVMVRLYLGGKFVKRTNAMWAYGIDRLWGFISAETRTLVRANSRKFADRNRYRMPSTHLDLDSKVLGRSVRRSFAEGCGFPNVYLPLLGHAIEIELSRPISASMAVFDRCAKRWIDGSAALKSRVAKGLIAYKDLVADACGENYDHITSGNVFDHIDITHGYVSEGEDGLILSLGHGCEWEPEHGVDIVIDHRGRLLKIGEG